MEPHYYNVEVSWNTERKGIMCSPELNKDAGSCIEVATPPEFPKGMPGIWSPEHLFTAAVQSCFMTTFLAIAEFSKLEFQQLLGPDTMPGFHPVVQLGVIRNFRLLPYELGTVAITHDWGELAVGDDIYSENPDETKKDIETQRRRSYIERMFQPNGADISSLVDIALDPSTDLGIQFKISERLGYMRTILRAYALSLEFEKLRNFETKNEVLRSIASHALFHIDPLGKASDSNPKILEFLERNANAIDSIQRNFDKPNDPVKPQ